MNVILIFSCLYFLIQSIYSFAKLEFNGMDTLCGRDRGKIKVKVERNRIMRPNFIAPKKFMIRGCPVDELTELVGFQGRIAMLKPLSIPLWKLQIL